MSEQQTAGGRLTAEELRQMRARCDVATPGPWRFMCDNQALECAGDDILVTMSDRRPSQEDCDFIEKSRTDIPRLLDEVERLQIALQGIADFDDKRYFWPQDRVEAMKATARESLNSV